jgi:hypothetical protein
MHKKEQLNILNLILDETGITIVIFGNIPANSGKRVEG